MTKLYLGGRRDCLLVVVEPRMVGLRPIGAEWAGNQSMDGFSYYQTGVESAGLIIINGDRTESLIG